MDFFRSKAWIAVAVICLAVIAAVIWFVMSGGNRRTEPEGTLVWERSITAPGIFLCEGEDTFGSSRAEVMG